MPDHVHLLAEGVTETADGLRFIARAKQFSGFYYSKQFGKPLWQRYGYEHVLRTDEESLGVAKYILENPVRAGLVRSPQDYEFHLHRDIPSKMYLMP
jgi:putative transposase